MTLDLSDVPESTVLAVHRLVQLSDEGRTGEVRINLNDGGVTAFHDPPHNRERLRQLARRENGR